MADNEDELVDYDEEEVRKPSHHAALDPLATRLQWYCTGNSSSHLRKNVP
jgi:hypothetical protein